MRSTRSSYRAAVNVTWPSGFSAGAAWAWSLLRSLVAATYNFEESVMLSWALAFFIIAIIAAVFGFTGIAAGAAEIAKILFVVFVVLFLVSLVAGLLRRP
jgi:uncharacterized membrane protein YtjA (UPF0391 family)